MAPVASLTLAVEPATSPDLRVLIEQLDRELAGMYPSSSLHTVDLAGFAAIGGVFYVARVDGVAVGCGALRPCAEPEICELKRMFVAPEHRRKGYARRLLNCLEKVARGRGIRQLRLETGAQNREALKLYENSGFLPIPPFDEYVSDPLSLCFEKRLV